MPSVMVLNGWVFGKCLDYDGGALMDRICILMKEALQSFLALSIMHWERRPTSDHGLPAPRTLISIFLLFASPLVYGILLL